MKRLLLVTRNFPPLWGGMERLNQHLADELALEYDVRLIAPEGAEAFSYRARVVPVSLRPLSRFLLSAAWNTLREARRWKPEVVLAGSGLTAPIALCAARYCGARAFAYTHGLDLTAAHPVYRAAWLPCFKWLDGIIANSRATAGLAGKLGVRAERLQIVHPGVEIPALDSGARARFRSMHGLGNRPVLLSVGRLTTRKGLLEFVRDVLPRITADRPDARLVVIGDAPTDSLHARVQTPEMIQTAALASGVAGNVVFLGRRFGRELADAYEAADVHVFPVRTLLNDPEGFGMVAIEAAAHGLPTVAYSSGGIVDAVAPGKSGLLVAPDDEEGFATSVTKLLAAPPDPAAIRGFAEGFAWDKFGSAIRASLA